ncbi:MAG TPA: hypothetical protein VM716_07605 [Gemmatimonadales bacterium]|nr:hypothetical protein [Gemmatimonadales bacterium]
MKWFCAAWLVALVAACGRGEAIFNVNVYSFLSPSQTSTPYAIPPSTTADTGTVPQKISLPGVGSSVVDSILMFGTLNLVNTGGTGTLGLQLFMASDSAGTYNPSSAVLTVSPKAVAGNQTVPDTVQGKLLPNADSLFTKSQLWVRVAAHGTNTGATLLTGTMDLTSLRLSVFINDKIF